MGSQEPNVSSNDGTDWRVPVIFIVAVLGAILITWLGGA
jgi:hypothetical protein